MAACHLNTTTGRNVYARSFPVSIVVPRASAGTNSRRDVVTTSRVAGVVGHLLGHEGDLQVGPSFHSRIFLLVETENSTVTIEEGVVLGSHRNFDVLLSTSRRSIELNISLYMAASGQLVGDLQTQKHIPLHAVLIPFADISLVEVHCNLFLFELLPCLFCFFSHLVLCFNLLSSLVSFETLISDLAVASVSGCLTVRAVRLGKVEEPSGVAVSEFVLRF